MQLERVLGVVLTVASLRSVVFADGSCTAGVAGGVTEGVAAGAADDGSGGIGGLS